MTYSLRSKVMRSLISGLRSMNTWRTTGCADSAVGPSRLAVGGHGAPAQYALAFSSMMASSRRLKIAAQRLVGGHEDHPDPIIARAGQVKAQRGAFADQECMRHLDQNASAVAGVGFAAARAAVGQVLQDGQGLVDDRVRGQRL